MGDPTYFTATVADNQDPDQLGRLSLIIPGYSGEDEAYPEWISPRVAPGAGAGAEDGAGAGWFFVPAVNSIVIVEVNAGGELRWTGAEWGAVNALPAFLAGNYPRRAGFTSPEGAHGLALDEDAGLLIQIADPADPEGPAHYLSLNPDDGQAKIGLISGSMFVLNETQALMMNAAGDTVIADSENGITIMQNAGAEYLSLAEGVASLAGADLSLAGGSTTIVGQSSIELTSSLVGAALTEPPILGTTFLTDLSTFLAGCVADAVNAPGVAAAAGVLKTLVDASLVSGTPHLSTVTTLE